MISGGLASIHHQYVAVDVGGGVRCEKDRRAFQVIVGTEAARWNVAEQVISLVFNHFVRHVRGEPSWRNGVDLDIMARPLYRQIMRKRNYSAFAGMISDCLHRLWRRASDARDRRHINDLTSFLLQHDFTRGLGA